MPPQGYRELVESCAVVPSAGIACLLLRGGDVLEWLQGQITQDVSGLLPGRAREACLCSPKGQILTVLTVSAFDEFLLLALPEASVGLVEELIDSTVFLEDVALERPGWTATYLQGPAAAVAARALGGLAHPCGLAGEGFLVWRGEAPILVVADEAAVEAVRLENGIPRWPSDFGDKTLPQEMGTPFVERHVSFNKGCYTGQEVVMRLHARGHTNRTWCVLRTESRVVPGAPVSMNGQERAGQITTSALSPDFGPLAGAMMRNDASAPGTKLKIGAIDGEVVEGPLRT